MPKALCIIGMVVAGLLLVLFGLDIALGKPFGGNTMMIDVPMLVCAALLGYASWDALRGLK